MAAVRGTLPHKAEANDLLNPSAEDLRECIANQKCWWCGRAGWKSLASHTVIAHGITAWELRELALFTRKGRLTDDEYHERQSAESKAKGIPPLVLEKRKMAGRGELSRAVLEKYKSAGLRKLRPHNCPECGVLIPTARPIRCSEFCRSALRRRLGRQWGLLHGIANLPKGWAAAANRRSSHNELSTTPDVAAGVAAGGPQRHIT